MCIYLDTRVARTDSHLSCQVVGETVIFHLSTGKYYSLNESASSIWLRLASPVAVRDLVKMQLDEFDAAPAEVERDAISLLLEMLAVGLIRIDDENALPGRSVDV